MVAVAAAVAVVVAVVVAVDCLLVSFANRTRLEGESGSSLPRNDWDYHSLNYDDPYLMESMTCEIDVDHGTRVGRARGRKRWPRVNDASLTMVLGPGGIPPGMFRMPYGGISLPFESCGLGIIGVAGA